MKDKIKKLFPFIIIIVLFIEYAKDYFRYIRFSGVFEFIFSSEEKLVGNIIADYHVIEKGLTMQNTRLGFGKQKIIKLINHCLNYKEKYNNNDAQVLEAVAVINEYLKFHSNFNLDPDLIEKIKKLQNSFIEVIPSKQLETTSIDYFKNTNSSFDLFSKSRRSIRNYSSAKIPKEKILNAVEIAINSPSSCNRQASRVYVYEDKVVMKKILEIQGGNRGFGHLANKLLIVTAELGASHGVYERNMPYVDGGIFAMNLLNGLHFNKIAACPLNCYFSSSKEKKLRKLCGIKKSEIFIIMISCGNIPDQIDIAKSYRYPVDNFITFN